MNNRCRPGAGVVADRVLDGVFVLPNNSTGFCVQTQDAFVPLIAFAVGDVNATIGDCGA